MTPTELRRLAEMVTPGEWKARMQMTKASEPLGWIIEHANGRIGWSSYATATPNESEEPPYTIGGANAAYIAALSPDVCIKLLDMIERLERALEPFAKEAKKWSPNNGWSKDDPMLDTCGIGENDLQVRDLRRARAALEWK